LPPFKESHNQSKLRERKAIEAQNYLSGIPRLVYTTLTRTGGSDSKRKSLDALASLATEAVKDLYRHLYAHYRVNDFKSSGSDFPPTYSGEHGGMLTVEDLLNGQFCESNVSVYNDG
jgi:hypothetical protein